MSDLNGLSYDNNNIKHYPPIAEIAVMSELMLMAAVLIQHNRRDEATLLTKRVQDISRGGLLVIYNEHDFKGNLQKLLTAIMQ